MSERQKLPDVISGGKQEKENEDEEEQKEEPKQLTSDNSDVKQEEGGVEEEGKVEGVGGAEGGGEVGGGEGGEVANQLVEDIETYFRHDANYGVSGNWPVGVTVMYYKLRMEYADVADTMQSLSMNSQPWCRKENSYCRKMKIHAEEILLRELISKLFDGTMGYCKLKCVTLDIALSYSPCNAYRHDCAEKLVSFKRFVETNIGADVKLSIQIANFYKLNEPDNVKGLCLLINSGAHLSVFSGDNDWRQFYNDVTAGNNLGNNQELPNYTDKRQRREEVDVMILNRLENIAPYFKETGMIPQDFCDVYSSREEHFTQAEVRNLTTQYYQKKLNNG